MNYIIDQLKARNLRHEIHEFDSGYKMIDIWKEDKFYCLQIEDGRIGLSLVTEQIDLSTIPDKWYYDADIFKGEFNVLIDKGNCN